MRQGQECIADPVAEYKPWDNGRPFVEYIAGPIFEHKPFDNDRPFDFRPTGACWATSSRPPASRHIITDSTRLS